LLLQENLSRDCGSFRRSRSAINSYGVRLSGSEVLQGGAIVPDLTQSYIGEIQLDIAVGQGLYKDGPDPQTVFRSPQTLMMLQRGLGSTSVARRCISTQKRNWIRRRSQVDIKVASGGGCAPPKDCFYTEDHLHISKQMDPLSYLPEIVVGDYVVPRIHNSNGSVLRTLSDCRCDGDGVKV